MLLEYESHVLAVSEYNFVAATNQEQHKCCTEVHIHFSNLMKQVIVISFENKRNSSNKDMSIAS